MEAIECIKSRRSVRSYNDKNIDKETLRDIIDCARLATTARNEQPWEFIVVKDKASLKKLADIAPNGGFLSGANAGIAVISKDAKYYLEDGCAATENILLAARAYGIGTCWIAGAKKDYEQEVLEHLDIPQGYKLVSLISMGYTDEFPEAHGKRELQDVLHEETF